MANDNALLLRPSWAFRVARAADTYVRSLPESGGQPDYLDRFLASLPVPERELEQQLLTELRQRLTTLSRHYAHTPAERARQLLVQQYQRTWTLQGLARAVGCTRTTLQKDFRRLTRTSVQQFLVQRRVSVAQRLLTGSDLKVSSIAREVGYRSHSAFARHFKTLTGSTLMTYRVGGEVPTEHAGL
jgi:AraC-like DNA-binding protein